MRWLMTALLAAALGGGPAPGLAARLQATDAFGRNVALQQPPRRIVSWAPNVTEILFALGLGGRVVGVTSYCDYPPQVRRLPKVGSITAPELERTLALSPDLVVGSRLNPRALLQSLDRLDAPSFAAEAPVSTAALFATIRALGSITGARNNAESLIRSMRARLDSLRRRTAGLPAARRPAVLLIYQLDPLWTAGSGTFADEAIRIAGGVNAAGDVKGYDAYPIEKVLAKKPQVILVTPMQASDAAAARRRVLQHPSLKNIPAVKSGRVYAVNPDLIDRAGPRIVQGIEQVARAIHPELFKRARAR